jgi:dUTP pyrophosphatase
MEINISKINKEFDDIPLPKYQTEGAAGMDVYAAITNSIIIPSHGITIVPTSLSVSIPIGYECQVRSRSGLAAKNGIFALNAPGTIDSDFRGEICVILANFSDNDFTINRGDRIAQLIVAKYETINWNLVDKLDDTKRGDGGFGSTGI